ncbi:DUF6083 domain-containing protein [Streptomyces mutabilis]|uniref:DUF6083 domain-containing protein n=1 Tax=Streptomyces mutabilis TaxID=67332 RepID=UPI00369BEA41
MRPTPAFTTCHWDGSPRAARPVRPLRVAATSPSRLLRTGQNGRCRLCGNRVDVHQRTDQRSIALHPAELAAARIPAPCRWHLSCGIAHLQGDGSAWCRIPHAVLCPGRPASAGLSPYIEVMRRELAVRSRRLIETGAFTPPAPACEPRPSSGRPVVQLLLGRYLADQPLEHIRCVAQTCQRRRCPRSVLSPHAPAGLWRLLPATAHRGQLALPAAPMAVYDLSRLPYTEQLRWRTQRCPAHAAADGAADLALTGWQVFDPLLHTVHIHTRLPHPSTGRHGQR